VPVAVLFLLGICVMRSLVMRSPAASVLTSGHGHRLDQLCLCRRLAGRLGGRRLARRPYQGAVAEVARGAVEAVGVHELGPGCAVLGAEERGVRSEVLRAGEEVRVPLDDQVARKEVELLASSLVAVAAERRTARVDSTGAK